MSTQNDSSHVEAAALVREALDDYSIPFRLDASDVTLKAERRTRRERKIRAWGLASAVAVAAMATTMILGSRSASLSGNEQSIARVVTSPTANSNGLSGLAPPCTGPTAFLGDSPAADGVIPSFSASAGRPVTLSLHQSGNGRKVTSDTFLVSSTALLGILPSTAAGSVEKNTVSKVILTPPAADSSVSQVPVNATVTSPGKYAVGLDVTYQDCRTGGDIRELIPLGTLNVS